MDQQEFNQVYNRGYKYTLVSKNRCDILFQLSQETIDNNIPGDFWEGGVYKGGTAMMLASLIPSNKILHLFDTFGSGMPETSIEDNYHKKGDFSDINFEEIKNRILKINENVIFHKGAIPDTLIGLEDSKLSFVHADMDIYNSTKSFTEFVYPRLSPGGYLLYDDYGFNTCLGCKKAVDEFFTDKPEEIIRLETNQALIKKI